MRDDDVFGEDWPIIHPWPVHSPGGSSHLLLQTVLGLPLEDTREILNVSYLFNQQLDADRKIFHLTSSNIEVWKNNIGSL